MNDTALFVQRLCGSDDGMKTSGAVGESRWWDTASSKQVRAPASAVVCETRDLRFGFPSWHALLIEECTIAHMKVVRDATTADIISNYSTCFSLFLLERTLFLLPVPLLFIPAYLPTLLLASNPFRRLPQVAQYGKKEFAHSFSPSLPLFSHFFLLCQSHLCSFRLLMTAHLFFVYLLSSWKLSTTTSW